MKAQSWTKYTDARLREEVHNALESLPESERTVLTLYYMAGNDQRGDWTVHWYIMRGHQRPTLPRSNALKGGIDDD